MAFDLASTITEVRIFDARSASVQSLFARDPTPQEQLAYERQRVSQKSGQVVSRVRPARLRLGCELLDHAQAAEDADDAGYGFHTAGGWVPLTPKVLEEQLDGIVDRDQVLADYGSAWGDAWSRWIADLEPWKLFLLARAPTHVERVAAVMFEGAGDYRPPEAAVEDREGNEGEDDEGN